MRAIAVYVIEWESCQIQEAEPAFFHEKPDAIPLQLIQDYFIKAVIDFTPSSGNWAFACVRKGLPYTGVTTCPEHSNGLQRWLLTRIKAGIADENDTALFRPDLVNDDDDKPPQAAAKKKAKGGAPDGEAGTGAQRRGRRGPANQALLEKLKEMYGGGEPPNDGDNQGGDGDGDGEA